MKTSNRFSALITLVLACTALAVPALAGTVYNNGPYNLNGDGWTINFGFSVQDTFRLGAQSQVNGLDFWVYEFPGDSLSSVHWQISGGPSLGGASVGGTAITSPWGIFIGGVLTDTPLWGGLIDQISITLPNWSTLNLKPGTYWLTLSDAAVASGDPVFWNENSGVGCSSPGCPSIARENKLGTISSEAFDIRAK